MKHWIKSLFAGGVLPLSLFGVTAAADALRWRPLAEQGNAVAETHMGDAYLYGVGAPQDYAKAIAWYRKAADQGNAAGEAALGLIYLGGSVPGVERDFAQAIPLIRKAADQGEAVAQFNMGAMYEYGDSMPKDHLQAYMWFNLSAVDVDFHGVAIKHRDEVAAEMTTAQIAEAQRMSSEWKPTK